VVSSLGVTEQHLDDADIDVLLEQVGGKAVPKVCSETRLFDVANLGGGVISAI